MLRKSLQYFGAVAGFAALNAIAPAAQAVVVDFTAATPFGDVEVIAPDAVNLSTEDAFGGFAAPTSNSFGTLETDLGLIPGDLDPDFLDVALEGSGVLQSLTVAEGEVLNFDFTFESEEDLFILDAFGVAFTDFAFVAVDGVVTPLTVSSVSAFESTVSGSFSTTFATAGTVDVAIGIVDVSDVTGTSTLSVTDAEVVPFEMEATGGLLLGAAALFWQRRRRAQVR